MNPIPSPFPSPPLPQPLAPAEVPVGTVVAFLGDVQRQRVPLQVQGWLVCDGSTLPVPQYPELFAVIGTLYTPASSGNGTFCLPDLRGQFLRGVDERPTGSKDPGSKDPDSSSRQRADGTQGAGVGSTQDWALQAHEHEYIPAVKAPAGGEGQAAAVGMESVKTSKVTPGNVNLSDNETRPTNVSVYFIIKYTRTTLFPLGSV